MTGAIAGSVGIFAYFLFKKRHLLQTKTTSERMLNKAKEEIDRERKDALLDLKSDLYKKRSEFELEMKKNRVELQRLQNKYQKKEDTFRT